MKLRFNEKAHGYWLDGRRCKSVTAVAKIPDDTYRLDMWRRRMTAIGLADPTNGPKLLARVNAHIADNQQLDMVCEDAMTYASANDAAARGTAAHKITETVDAGQPVVQDELGRSISALWLELVDRAGLEIVTHLVERIVVYPEYLIAGKFDRVVRTVDGQLVIADLKTGEHAHKYNHSIAIQLALYANAPLLAGTLDWQGETETFEMSPPVNKEYGLIVHIPAKGTPDVLEVDIAAAWELFNDAVAPILEWRNRRDLSRPYQPPLPAVDTTDATRLELLERIAGLTPETRDALRHNWPYPGRSLKTDGWTADELAHLATVVRVTNGFRGVGPAA